ncbi:MULTISPECIES: QueT transporter family protein [Virgibacillus]|uniref:QueT transporter family protein n=1 Tax=Virgibacillus dokdonensis TaxID=302167 RepID=A0A2K9J0E2_9BACI|nr:MULTISPECIES: QueT transporter family protein [Virgibacillus]AUJ23471.1 Queuosine precursor transporter QueT [Virgibacillus dokdonensis]NWO12618.1 QueT transporter family protein [Virgibacillus sp.]
MHKLISQTSSPTMISELTKIAIISSLYVIVTISLAPISFGAIQFRLSEMFNFLALYHKRYVIAVTFGVVIANFMSPTWFFDVPIGSISTFLVLIFCRHVTQQMKNDILKIATTAIIFAVSMFTVATQLTLLFDLPFFYTWLTVGIGELLSMTIGGIVIYWLAKRVDFTK